MKKNHHKNLILKIKPISALFMIHLLTVANPINAKEVNPVKIDANNIEGITDKEAVATGNAILQKDNQQISAETLKYIQTEDRVQANENISIKQQGGTLKGQVLDLFLDKREGNLIKPIFTFDDKNARGSGDVLYFEGKDKYRLENARYTTCSTDSDAWFITSKEMTIDRNVQVANAKSAMVEFKGHNILYLPYFNFPLDKGRHSGFLMPSFTTSGKNGLDFSIPYYFNLASNYDLTLTPRYIQKRGVYLGSEFRYLQPNYFGTANLEYLPNDAITSSDRYHFNLQHEQFFSPNLKFSVDFQGVSDDNYFRDLSSKITDTSKTNLIREIRLDYQWDMWNLMGRMQRYQTLQDPLTPVLPPYDRYPQVKLTGNKLNFLGNTNLLFDSEFVRFDKSSSVTGNRLTFYPSLVMPKLQADWHIIPKIGLHVTHYQLDNLNYATSPVDKSTTRVLPIASLDIGATLEKNVNIFGKNYYQTLEPRFYYLYVPYKDQSKIPLFDTTFADLSFDRMFYENNFMGGDRISDSNQITLAVMSKLISSKTGDEVLRAGIGQRFYFSDQKVTLNSLMTPKQDKFSDIITFVSGKLNPFWRLDTAWQYNPHVNKTIKANVYSRYQPTYGNVFNVGYRFNREDPNEPLLKQFDIAGQWQLNRNWYGLGRVNYSIADHKILEGLGGVEYNGGCWAVRVVGHRLATATEQATTTLFVQLELNGVSRLGTNPIETLRRNIDGYTKTNDNDKSFENFVIKNRY